MKKEKILVRDNKGIFLKMFKRKLKTDFDFFEKSFFDNSEDKIKEYDRIIYVVYDRNELLGFLQENRNRNVLVCLFDKQFYASLSFLEIMNNLVLFDEYKTRREIFKEIKAFFKKKLESTTEKVSSQSNIPFPDYYKAMYYLM
ncbi:MULTISPECIES: hypothetical protein [Flavobacterium]|nr:hypothetical protein [Flavobacterium sp. IB48]MBJ2126148.1 hypothetical protein [Flavobacterium sp. IB48]